METHFSYDYPLPEAAKPAVKIVRRLRDAGHNALLAGGCVRDLLLGNKPHDYDVATDATPDQVCELFRSTRKVGVQFGVVLVKQYRVWVEVATFRTDGVYSDGRRPDQVVFCDAEHDAQRRDFTVNGMFFDPMTAIVIDYVGGKADLSQRVIRAIGEPIKRFNEDYLRLLRAVRFAARLGFDIEPATALAIRTNASKLSQVAAERILDELARMLANANRSNAFDLLLETQLLDFLWPKASWGKEQIAGARSLLLRLPENATFELALAAILADRGLGEIGDICAGLACSNFTRQTVRWLVSHQADLDDPDRPSLAELKRLLANPAFDELRKFVEARFADIPNGLTLADALDRRILSIPPESIQPSAFINGTDLTKLGVEPGPIFRNVLDEIYTRQLNETIATRDGAIEAAKALLKSAGFDLAN